MFKRSNVRRYEDQAVIRFEGLDFPASITSSVKWQDRDLGLGLSFGGMIYTAEELVSPEFVVYVLRHALVFADTSHDEPVDFQIVISVDDEKFVYTLDGVAAGNGRLISVAMDLQSSELNKFLTDVNNL